MENVFFPEIFTQYQEKMLGWGICFQFAVWAKQSQADLWIWLSACFFFHFDDFYLLFNFYNFKISKVRSSKILTVQNLFI